MKALRRLIGREESKPGFFVKPKERARLKPKDRDSAWSATLTDKYGKVRFY